MAVKRIDLRCSGCGAALDATATFCDYCGNPIVITSFDSILGASQQSLARLAQALEHDATGSDTTLAPMAKFTQAACWLRLKLYDKARQRFEEAIEENFDNPEAYFYAAVATLKGKKAFLTPLAEIRKALAFLDAALAIESRGVFHYMKAYLKYDFFARKHLNVSPTWQEELSQALANNLSQADATILFDILGVSQPAQLTF